VVWRCLVVSFGNHCLAVWHVDSLKRATKLHFGNAQVARKRLLAAAPIPSARRGTARRRRAARVSERQCQSSLPASGRHPYLRLRHGLRPARDGEEAARCRGIGRRDQPQARGGPGALLVVPFSATPPGTPGPWDVFFQARSYRSFTRDVWAKCASLTLVSHARLDRVISGRGLSDGFSFPNRHGPH
jgi:hypothetical protein